MKTVAELIAYIEKSYPCVIGLPTNRCQTGDLYVVIGQQAVEEGPSSIPGTVDETKASELAFDEETAVNSMRAAFDDYALDRAGTLYWRMTPYLDKRQWHGKTRCKVRMRLVISDKPAVYETVDAICDERQLDRVMGGVA